MNGAGSEDGEPDGSPSDVGGDDPEADRIEPGRPSAENVAFVLLGALGTLYVIARVAGLV